MSEQPNTPGTNPHNPTGRLGEQDGYSLIGISSEAAFAAVGTAPEPGTVCPTCSRRVNHPKKHDSPTSRGRTYKVPADELAAHDEILDTAAEYIGAAETPFAKFKTITAALACLLQDPGAKGLHGETTTERNT
jgi:hypothetical protein